mgnify:CR=1 FL=1
MFACSLKAFCLAAGELFLFLKSVIFHQRFMVLGTIDIIIPNGVLLCISKKRQTLMDEFVFPSLIIIMIKLKNIPARKQWSLLASLMNWKNSMMTRSPILQNVWRSSMKKNRKSRLQSTLLFTIQIDFVSVITCEKTLAMLH